MLKLKKIDIYNTILKALYGARPITTKDDIHIIDTDTDDIWISLHHGTDAIKINKADFPFSLQYLHDNGISVLPADRELMPFLFKHEDSAEEVIFESVGCIDQYGREQLRGTFSDGSEVWINKAYREQFTPSARFEASRYNKPVLVYEFDTGAKIGVIMPINRKYMEVAS